MTRCGASALLACIALSFIGCGAVTESVPDAEMPACDSVAETDPAYCGPLVLATGQAGPYGLALTDTDVYWFNSGSGALMRCAKSGCGGSPTQIAMGAPKGFFVAADATHVYWNHNTDGELLRCPQAGCPDLVPEVIAQVAKATFIAVDDDYLYASTNVGRLVRVPKAGGQVVDLATGLVNPGGIALVGDSVVWAIRGENRIVAVPISGGAPEPIVLDQARVQVVAANRSTLVWATENEIYRSTLTGEAPTRIASANRPVGIAVNDTDVYWTNTEASSVAKAPLAGGPEVVLATDVPHPAVLAVDDNYVFFTAVNSGTVHRVPR